MSIRIVKKIIKDESVYLFQQSKENPKKRSALLSWGVANMFGGFFYFEQKNSY